MRSSSRFALLCALLLSVSLVCLGGESALAGTTGTITGTVVDASTRAPIAGAEVTASSPSQVDARHDRRVGPLSRFSRSRPKRTRFPPRAPDTTRLRLPASRSSPIRANRFRSCCRRACRQIARVTSRSSLSPVRPGTGTDVYSVSPGLTSAAATLGGGGGLNNAYSAIAAMPGAYVPPNQVGVNQTVYIRGGYYDQIGYEYDGVPINRSFDNYPGNSEIDARPARAADLHRRRRGRRQRDRSRGLHQSSHQDGNVPRLRDRRPRSGHADLLSRRPRRSRRLDAGSHVLVLRRRQRNEPGSALFRSIQRREPDRYDPVRLLAVVRDDASALLAGGLSRLPQQHHVQ